MVRPPPNSSRSILPPNGKKTPKLQRASEESKLEGLVEQLTDRATNQFHRIHNLVKTLDVADEIKKISKKQATTAQSEASPSKPSRKVQPTAVEKPSSSATGGSFSSKFNSPFNVPTKSSSIFSREINEALKPLQNKFVELQQIFENMELHLQDYSHRLSRIEGEIHQLVNRFDNPHVPSASTPSPRDMMGYHSSMILEPDFVQSISRRLDNVESHFSNKSKAKSSPKGKARLKRESEEEQSPLLKKTKFS